MHHKTKVRIASVLSLLAGVMVMPRPSAARGGVPVSDIGSQQTVQQSLTSTSEGTIATSNIKAVLYADQLQRFNQQFGARSSIRTKDLINFVIDGQKTKTIR